MAQTDKALKLDQLLRREGGPGKQSESEVKRETEAAPVQSPGRY